MNEEFEFVKIPNVLVKRIITYLWYQDTGIDDVKELSEELINWFPEYFVDISENGEYIGTRPEWLQDDKNANLIDCPEGDESDIAAYITIPDDEE